MIADARFIPLKDESVNCVVTSPPYWGLRKYSIPDLVWDEDENCQHEWTLEMVYKDSPTRQRSADCFTSESTKKEERWRPNQFCLHCSAWRGQLGLEPSIELYFSHLLQITKEIWRVLRKDGVLWLNIGDSYAGSGQGWGKDAGLTRNVHQTGCDDRPIYIAPGGLGKDGKPPTANKQNGLKPKDLCLIPFRLALALQQQGWWVRSDIIWAKPNPMPESVKDRPTRSHEYIFLLTKSQHYFWDQDAVREPHTWIDENGKRIGSDTIGQIAKRKRFKSTMAGGGTNARTHCGSSMNHPNGRNIRSVWTIATQPYPEAHYATFPEELVERCIKAGCPKGGIVLDPFAGSGTVQGVTEKLNRIGIGCDLAYQDLQIKRMKNIQKEIFA